MPQYIEVHAELTNHPKLKRLKRALGIPAVYAKAHLIELWQWAMDYSPNGDLSRHEAVDIAEGACWEGDPDEFVNALLGCGVNGGSGFLERTSTSKLIIHDWHKYAGKLLVTRFCDAFRKRNGRVATADEIRAAGLFPPEMGGGGEEKDKTPPPSPVPPTDSEGVQRNPKDSNGFRRSVAKRSLEQPRAAYPSVAENSSSSVEESPRGDPAPADPPGPPPAPVPAAAIAAAADSPPNGFLRLGDEEFLAKARLDYPAKLWPELWQRVEKRLVHATRNPAGYARPCLEEHYAAHPPGTPPPLPRSSPKERQQERDRAAEGNVVRAPEHLRKSNGLPVKPDPGAEPPHAPPNATFAATKRDLAKRLGTTPSAREEPAVEEIDPEEKARVDAALRAQFATKREEAELQARREGVGTR